MAGSAPRCSAARRANLCSFDPMATIDLSTPIISGISASNLDNRSSLRRPLPVSKGDDHDGSNFGFGLATTNRKRSIWKSPRALSLWFLFGCGYTAALVIFLSTRFEAYVPVQWINDLPSARSIAFGVMYGSAFCIALVLTWMCVEDECALGVEADGLSPTNRRIKWRRLAGWLWTAVGVAAFCSAPFAAILGYYVGMSAHSIVIVTAGIFAGLAVVLGLKEIGLHMANYYRPKLQRHIIRVLWMVPIYAVDAFAVVCADDHDPVPPFVLSTIRNLWESYTIWSFQSFLFEFLQGVAVERLIDEEFDRALLGEDGASTFGSDESDQPDQSGSDLNDIDSSPARRLRQDRSTFADLSHFESLVRLMQQQKPAPHVFPFCQAKPWVGREFILKNKVGVVQYVVVQIVCTLVSVTTFIHVSYEGIYFWTTLIQSISQAVAIYCLFYFYQGTKVLLAPIRPVGKFVCIKLVVFFTFWQTCGFQLLDHYHVLKLETSRIDWPTEQQFSTWMAALLICAEMLAFALAHRQVFSFTDYVPSNTRDGNEVNVSSPLAGQLDDGCIRNAMVPGVPSNTGQRSSAWHAVTDMFDNGDLGRAAKRMMADQVAKPVLDVGVAGVGAVGVVGAGVAGTAVAAGSLVGKGLAGVGKGVGGKIVGLFRDGQPAMAPSENHSLSR